MLVVALHRACGCKVGHGPGVVLQVLWPLDALPAAAMCGAVGWSRRWPPWQDTGVACTQDTDVARDRHAACLCFVDGGPLCSAGLHRWQVLILASRGGRQAMRVPVQAGSIGRSRLCVSAADAAHSCVSAGVVQAPVGGQWSLVFMMRPNEVHDQCCTLVQTLACVRWFVPHMHSAICYRQGSSFGVPQYLAAAAAAGQ